MSAQKISVNNKESTLFLGVRPGSAVRREYNLPPQNSNVGLFVCIGVTADVTDEDDVVAAVVPIFVAAFGDVVIDFGELVLVRPGEFVGMSPLGHVRKG